MDKIVELYQTCSACPSQWEGKTDKGEMAYIRYRWGCLSVTKSEGDSDDINDAIPGIEIHYSEPGNDFDGVMTTEEMQEATKESIEWATKEANLPDN